MTSEHKLSVSHSWRVTLWSSALVLLPVTLFGYGLIMEHAAVIEETDVARSSSLCTHSLRLYGATRGDAAETWADELARMTTERDGLRSGHPSLVARTDTIWYEFEGALRHYGRIDWKTANRMCAVFAGLTATLRHEAERQRRWADNLFAAGLLLTSLSSLLPIVVARRKTRQEHERLMALQASEERFQAARDGSLDAFFLLTSVRDSHGHIHDFTFVDINHRAEALLLRPRDQVIGQRLCELLPMSRTHGFINKYIYVAETGEQLEDEFEGPAEGIDATWLQQQVVRVGDGIAITSRDISQSKAIERSLIEQQVELLHINDEMEQHITLINEQKVELEMQKLALEEANERLAALATTDGLTGLKNHRTFQEKLAEECERFYRYGKPVSLLVVDVDHFKSYNDSFGHPAGDQVLMEVARILQTTSRATDFVARYGGEEFVIILPCTDAHGAVGCGERICAAISGHFWEKRNITVSIGVATLDCATQSATALIAEADQALYVSKSNGRNCVTHHNTEMIARRASASR